MTPGSPSLRRIRTIPGFSSDAAQARFAGPGPHGPVFSLPPPADSQLYNFQDPPKKLEIRNSHLPHERAEEKICKEEGGMTSYLWRKLRWRWHAMLFAWLTLKHSHGSTYRSMPSNFIQLAPMNNRLFVKTWMHSKGEMFVTFI